METKRLILRPWCEEDAEALYRYAKDPRVGPAAGWPTHTSVENSRAILRGVLSARETYAVVLKETKEPVGSVGITIQNRTFMGEGEAEIGYWIGVPFWGRGLIPEAVEALLARCFLELDCPAVWCGYYDGNEKSRRVQEKCGFRPDHTGAPRPCPLLGETRVEHFTRQTRAQWDGRWRDSVRARLSALRDEGYAAFQRRLIPTVPPERILGVRTPALRELAKTLRGTPEAASFLRQLPHEFFEENQLHALLISGEKDFGAALAAADAFLPHVDNWATCDQLSPKAFAKHKPELLTQLRRWLRSAHPYTIRFAVRMLMEHFLGGDFDPAYPEWVAATACQEYYVNMMAAWYFATALAKQYDAVIGYLEAGRLSPWVHRKTIQKAVESYRIPEERKAYLRTLRR